MDTTFIALYGHQDETVVCMKDECEEAKSFDKHAVGTFKNNVLVGHVPIELSRLITTS